MKNINTIETSPHAEQEAGTGERFVLREKLENDVGYSDEADMLAAMWAHLREHGVKSDENLLFTGHNTLPDSLPDPREETFAVTAEDYTKALTYHFGETPLQYIDDDPGGVPTVSVYDGTKLLPIRSRIGTMYRALPGQTVEDALIAEFDVSNWV
jgi:hypothetical protein